MSVMLISVMKRHKPPYRECFIPIPQTPCPQTSNQISNMIVPEMVAEAYATPSPEVQLLFAIIERARFDLELADARTRRSAVAWFRSKSVRPWSFQWVADHLRLSRRIQARLRMLARETTSPERFRR